MTRASPSLYGDPHTLDVDRSLAELRSGRAVRVLATDGVRLVVSVETLRPSLLEALAALAGDDLRVVTTRERAAALGWAVPHGGVGWRVPGTITLGELQALAGMAPPAAAASSTVSGEPVSARPTITAANAAERAALQLAKYARLLPTVLSVRDEGVQDPRLLSVGTEAIAAFDGADSIDLECVSDAAVPLEDVERCRLVVFRDRRDGSEHVAMLVGDVDPDGVVDVRVHSACLTGDLLGSLRCDCGDQLRGAVRRFAALGAGVLLYVGQEGRGIGLANKLRAYRLQEAGLDTIEADRHLGFVGDERRYELAARMLRELGIGRVRLHSNSTRKASALALAGVDVIGFRTLAGAVNPHNERYIRVRRERAGHVTPDPE